MRKRWELVEHLQHFVSHGHVFGDFHQSIPSIRTVEVQENSWKILETARFRCKHIVLMDFEDLQDILHAGYSHTVQDIQHNFDACRLSTQHSTFFPMVCSCFASLELERSNFLMVKPFRSPNYQYHHHIFVAPYNALPNCCVTVGSKTLMEYLPGGIFIVIVVSSFFLFSNQLLDVAIQVWTAFAHHLRIQ